MTHALGLGSLGEKIACRFLVGKGYAIIETNFRKPWGEIDVVGSKDGLLTFFEVKTRAKSGFPVLPEEQVNQKKMVRLARSIETYMNERKIPLTQPIQLDVLALELDFERRKSKIRHIKNIEFN